MASAFRRGSRHVAARRLRVRRFSRRAVACTFWQDHRRGEHPLRSCGQNIVGTPFVGDYRRATVVHDVACQDKTRPHEEVHYMFYEAMLCDGVPDEQAFLMYTAVRLFGPKWPSSTSRRRSREALRRFDISRLVATLDTALGRAHTLEERRPALCSTPPSCDVRPVVLRGRGDEADRAEHALTLWLPRAGASIDQRHRWSRELFFNANS